LQNENELIIETSSPFYRYWTVVLLFFTICEPASLASSMPLPVLTNNIDLRCADNAVIVPFRCAFAFHTTHWLIMSKQLSFRCLV
jgi:hypothetical protein